MCGVAAYFSVMASLLPESENSFYDVRMSASCPTPNLKGRCVFVQHLAQNLSGMGSPMSSWAVSSIAIEFTDAGRLPNAPECGNTIKGHLANCFIR